MPAGDLILYAQWTELFTVTFDSNGGSAVAAETVPDGGLATDPGAPVRAGNIFDGWYADPGLTTLWNFAVDTVTANITLYAGWTPINYLVSFDIDGGDGGTTGDQSVTFNGSVTLSPSTFTRVGHRFMGWSETPGGTVDWNDGASYNHTIETNRTLYAVWEQEYTVTYTALDADLGGTPPVDANVYIAGQTVTVLGNTGSPARTDHTFGGWTDGITNYVADATFFMPSNNVTMDPIWVPEFAGGDGTLINTGALIGSSNMLAPSFVRDSYAIGTVNSDSYTVGGLIGFAGEMTIERSFTAVSVNSTVDSASLRIGGLVGMSNSVTISDSYAVGTVTAGVQGFVGGLLGGGIGTTINRSYAAGRVTTGGAAAGGLVGDGAGVSVTDAFYDTYTTGMTDTGYGIPLTTGQMVYEANLVGFSFLTTWINDEGVSYPYLQRQMGVNVSVVSPTGSFRHAMSCSRCGLCSTVRDCWEALEVLFTGVPARLLWTMPLASISAVDCQQGQARLSQRTQYARFAASRACTASPSPDSPCGISPSGRRPVE